MAFNSYISLKSFALTVESDSTFGEDNLIDLEGKIATYISFINYGDSVVTVRFDDDPESDWRLPNESSQVFHHLDVMCGKIDFQLTESGASASAIEVQLGVQKVD